MNRTSCGSYLEPIPAASPQCFIREEDLQGRRRGRRRKRPPNQQQHEHQHTNATNYSALSSASTVRPSPHRKTDQRLTKQRRRRSVVRMFLSGTVVVTATALAAFCHPCAEGLKLVSAVPSVVSDLPVRPATRPAAAGGASGGDGGIGDMHRSDSSTSRYFRSIDSDGDGILEKPEIEQHIRETIGGSAFDTSAEVEAGVDQVLERLDRDQDEGLDRGDVLAYWMQLESLLTADEVAEWVVQAVQLPESVGDIFKEHLVTGYDFPELVDHDGKAIAEELGIEKASYRKKILRHINARMLGIGTVPTPPYNIKHTLESCSTVSLSWTKSTAKGFPVHSYRVQRMAIPLHAAPPAPVVQSTGAALQPSDDSNSSNNGRDNANADATSKVFVCDAAIDASQTYFPTCGGEDVSYAEEYALVCTGADSTVPDKTKTKIATKPASFISTANVPSPPYPKPSSWVTVYRGGDNDFVDTGLEMGYTYLYRVQAWNSVGRSEWVTLDIARSLKKHRCTTDRKGNGSNGSKPFTGVLHRARSNYHDDSDGWNILTTIYLIFDFTVTFIRAIFALAAVGAAIMRFRRANALSSTSANMEPVFPWLWRGINKLAVKIFGVEIIPNSMLGDKTSKRVSSTIYDKEVKSVGLAGYHRSPLSDEPKSFSNGNSRLNRRVVFGKRKSASMGDLYSTLNNINEDDLVSVEAPNGLGRRIASNESTTTQLQSTTLGIGSSKKASSLKKALFGRSKSTGTDDTGESSSEDDIHITSRSLPANISTSTRSLMTNMSTIDEDDGTVRTNNSSTRDLMDDYNRCNCCHKRYKFPHRFRHHCARCLSTFCNKHGKTTHSNLIACKVPSDCICNRCLEVDDSTSKSSWSGRSSRNSGRN